MPKGNQEGLLVYEHDGQLYAIRKNGSVHHYKLIELTFGDWVEMTGADQATI